jgi:hypothetical protein
VRAVASSEGKSWLELFIVLLRRARKWQT